ncbi:hypothetical protein AB0J28_45765 [Streptosporangium canum]|uniref:hypothetical protein n=1 Tax=Streptosporangium canum TaxID=324952 RepID=UPI00342DD3DD
MNSHIRKFASGLRAGKRVLNIAAATTLAGAGLALSYQAPAAAITAKPAAVQSYGHLTGVGFRSFLLCGGGHCGGPYRWNTCAHRCHHHHHHCCNCHDGRRGRRGVQGVQGPQGPRGPQGVQGPRGEAGRNAGIDTAFQGNNKFIGRVENGTALIRDPRTTPPWNNISTLVGFPAGATDISLAVMGNTLHVTVLGADGAVRQTSCTVNPTPGTGNNPAWPGNCTDFVNLTPPL